MRSGTLNLQPIYELLKKEGKGVTALLQLNGRNAPGRAYSRKIQDIAMPSIPDEQGFYLWGSYNKKGLWENIYLGKTALGRGASLRKRIVEELKDERCFAFRPFRTAAQLHKIRKTIHNGKYEKSWTRALLKSSTTHIVWVSTPKVTTNKDLLRIESDLIESMNPKANIKRPPPPKGIWQQDTQEVFGYFRQQIHRSRGDRFYFQLK